MPRSIVLANFVVLVSEGPLPTGAVIIKSDPHEVFVVIKARSGLLQVLEVRYVVYGGQVRIPLPAVLLSIGPAQLLVHVVVGFDRRQGMVPQEEPCKGNHSQARRQSVLRVVLCRHKNTLLVSYHVSFATCIFKTLHLGLLQLIVSYY